MGWWLKAIRPIRRIWVRAAKRLGIRKNGLMKLRNHVSACKYEDVHVMWELLHKTNEEKHSRTPVKKLKRPFWKLFVGASRSPI
ncbi:hypothetical protein CKAN_00218100 [Cinnamomum micranthum f. kanehirae]|uniref:Uncharacterized protein n=1 Tax=Cinnamomum micranthum f. kanehirae TaxID=337451 RepID=A0A3S3MS88_9MAGN|nr:hypothetical protein CKAN_00218100 [Cinnamomum micranthum f. kanehirae]